MTTFSLEKELKENSYPGRGIVIGRSADGKHAETVFLLRMVRESAHRHLTRPNLQTRA